MSTITQEPPAGIMETSIQESGRSKGPGSMQLVSFKLSDETYGIEITKIREIILVGEITRVPETPHYIKGLINLRSSVIPVIDLRARFSLAENDCHFNLSICITTGQKIRQSILSQLREMFGEESPLLFRLRLMKHALRFCQLTDDLF